MADVIKPFKLTAIQSVHPVKGKSVLFVTAAFGISLDAPDTLLTEADYLTVSSTSVPPGTTADMGYPKDKGEFLIAGEAQAPDGNPVQALTVTCSVGSLTRRVSVFGDRYWHREDGLEKISEPKPFTAMPLSPQFAYGGENHPVNPAGRGAGASVILEQLGYAPLPNIEDSSALIRSINDEPEPVFVGGLSHEHPLRKDKAGTPTAEWLANDFPEWPPGFNPSYFNIAAAKQRMDGHFNGDEAVTVMGMSAERPAVHARLPGLRARCFAMLDANGGSMKEIPLKLDTVWLFGTSCVAGLYHHGFMEVADNHATDVETLLFALENLTDEERPSSYYAEIYTLRTDPEERALHIMNDQQLMPPLSEAEAKAVEQRTLDHSLDIQKRTETMFAAEIEQVKRESQLPPAMMPDLPLPKVPLIPVPAAEDIIAGRIDMAKMMKDIRAVVAETQAESDARKAAEFAKIAQAGMPMPKDPSAALTAAMMNQDPSLKEMFKSAAAGGDLGGKAGDTLKDLVKKGDAETQPGMPKLDDVAPGATDEILANIDEIMERMPGVPKDGPVDGNDLFEKARALALALPEADPFYAFKQQMAALKDESPPKEELPFPEGLSADEALKKGTLGPPAPVDAKAVKAQFDSGLDPINKAEFDKLEAMVGSLLPGLAGKDIPPSLAAAKELETVKVPDAPDMKFESVDDIINAAADAVALDDEAFFTELDEEERAHFLDSDHARTQLPEAMYPEEPYSPDVSKRLGDLVVEHLGKGEVFAGRDMAGIDLSGRDVSGQNLEGAFFENGTFEGARLAGAVISRAAMTGVNLSRTDATGTDFRRTNFCKVSAREACFDRTLFDKRAVMNADFSGSSFERASFTQMDFLELIAAGTQFNAAVFEQCSFIDCDFTAAEFKGARFSRSMFVNCKAPKSMWNDVHLDRILFVDFNGPGASFRDSAFIRSGFVGESELRGAVFDGMRTEKAGFIKTQLKEASFIRANVQECTFFGCDLASADFRVAEARRTIFSESSLKCADFFGANLFEAQLNLTDARCTAFRGANLHSSNLFEAELAGADFTAANLGLTHMEVATNGR